ncbi:MAG: ribonucleoside triphosphate reductase, partial [Clostridia bacterium]|nr:ribonucleoside triphosphate reductase [Clostridia bacterium]
THMRDRLSDFQEMYGDLYNLEATPAESTTYRFAKHDKERYPEIITASEGGTPYYTNSSHLPVGYTDDIFEALDVQDELQTLYTSGTVFHAFLGQKLSSWEAAAALVRKIAENYRLPYYTLSPTYSICTEHGYLAGEHFTCPVCGKKAEVYSRITGYYRPVQNWNDGKAAEYKQRLTYKIREDQGACAAAPAACCEKTCDDLPTVAQKKLVLVTTTTCPNCRIAKKLLDDAGISYEVSNADENPAIAKEHGITKAPTLLIFEEDGSVKKLSDLSAIRAVVANA